MLGLNEADREAAGTRYEELRSAADRFRSAGNRGADAPARLRGFGAARHGFGRLVARIGSRPLATLEASGTAATPPSAFGSAR